MKQDVYLLDAVRRDIVMRSLHEVCSRRDWLLLAAHVRTNHVHTIVDAQCKPEAVMVAMKAQCSRALNGAEIENRDRRRWARHGSTRYLWTMDAVHTAIRYVVHEQGEPMAVFEAPPILALRLAEVAPRYRSGF